MEVVVDKDLTAAVLAEDLKADFLLILTDVPCVYDGYGTPDQRTVLHATPAELRRGGFPAGSMGPKAEAAARFVERTGRWSGRIRPSDERPWREDGPNGPHKGTDGGVLCTARPSPHAAARHEDRSGDIPMCEARETRR